MKMIYFSLLINYDNFLYGKRMFLLNIVPV